ncbi:MAG: AAA family ATPase [Thermoplasmata archaeon]|nr:AAA family ATPase [Thermoplasmata archaeon]
MASAARPFVGRLEAVDALRRRQDAAVSGQGGLTLLIGEPGVGKSTLVDRVIREAEEKGIPVLVGRAPSLDNPPPFLLLRRALQSGTPPSSSDGQPSSLAFAAFPGPGPTLIGFAPRAEHGRWADGHQVEERLLEQLGDPGGVTPAGTGRMAGSLAQRLLQIATNGSALLVLDDIHLADEPSLETLLDLAPQLGGRGLWVLATSLPMANLGEARRAVIEQIRRAGRAEEVVVAPLSAPEVGEFVRLADPGRTVREDEIIWWHSQSGGNPSFLEQLLRSPEPAPRSGGSALPPPAEFSTYLAQQLSELSEAERRTLTVAAILGRVFPFALLLRASDEDEEALSEIVQVLVHHGILKETAAEEIEFIRGDLRDQLDATLTAAHRRLLHRRAAEALEALGVADEATVYALALHYYLGKVDGKAAEFNRTAGELAAEASAPAVARQHLERALESQRRLTPRDRVAELELTLDLAVQIDRLGELNAAETLLRTALTEIANVPEIPASHRALVQVYLARILGDEGQWAETDQLTAPLLTGTGIPEGPLTQMTVHRLRGEMFYFRGKYDESLRHHDAALELARSLRNEREIARETVRRANVLGMIPGRLDEAIEGYHIASKALLGLGDKGEASYALLYLGVVLAQHGRLAESLDQLAAAGRLAEEAHEPRRLGWALFNAADVERELGEIARASEANRRAGEILGRVGDRFGLLQTHIVEGKIRLASGDLAGAEVELLEAYRLVRELRTPADELEVILRLAELAELRGDPAAARARLEELTRGRVDRLRPDLVPDLDRLRERLGRSPGASSGPTR